MNVLFDLDGTLTDPREGIVGCIKHALVALRRPVPSDDLLATFIGPPLRDTFSELLGTHSSGHEVDAAVATYRERFAAVGMFENAVHAGIPEVLDALSARGARLFVATSKPRVFAERILDHFELAKRFDEIYGSELDGRLADKADLVRHALTASSLAPADTVMVGDRLHDVVGALRNGVFPVGVLWGFGSEQELLTAGAKRIFGQTHELAHLVHP
jgi:phosphoglycolate phosphatase